MGLGYSSIVLPRGSVVVLFWGSYLESYKVIPKRNCGASGYIRDACMASSSVGSAVGTSPELEFRIPFARDSNIPYNYGIFLKSYSGSYYNLGYIP